jgi:hypothetical protein
MMESENIIKEIVNEAELYEMLKVEKAIVWIWVNWSVYAYQSRSVIHQVLKRLELIEIPIFKIDCSEQENRYVEDWLATHSKGTEYLYSNGYGEMLLVENGRVVDYIKFPGALGIEKTKETIVGWLK